MIRPGQLSQSITGIVLAVFVATPQNVNEPIYGAITGSNEVLVQPLGRVRSQHHVFDAADSIARHTGVFAVQTPNQDLDFSPQVLALSVSLHVAVDKPLSQTANTRKPCLRVIPL